jgi:hypothetical protein
MTVIATTYFGEKITLRGMTKAEAMSLLGQRGVTKGWIYKVQVKR